MNQPAITLENVSIRYGRTQAIEDVSARFAQGSLTAVAGPNGSGKSTLLKTIAGIIRPMRGTVTFAPALENRIAYLSQTSFLRRDFPMPVLQAVCTGLLRHAGEGGAITPAMRGQAMEALEKVGLADLADRQIATLSGGQFQRMLFARTILEDAKIILLDEPFTALDGATTNRLIQIILNWHDEGRTIICVLHDLFLIQKYFPQSVVMSGRCLGSGHTHEMFEQNLLSYHLDMAELQTKPAASQPQPHEHNCDCC